MSRVLPVCLLALLALASLAATPAAADSIAITGLPAEPLAADGTTATLVFNVTATVDMGKCPSGTAQAFTVAIAAVVPDAATSTVAVEVETPTLLFSIPPAATASAAWSATQSAAVKLNAMNLTSDLEANTTIMATVSAVNCNIPVQEPDFGPGGTASALVQFRPTGTTPTDTGPTEEPVPGLEIPALVLAVLGLALILRRRK